MIHGRKKNMSACFSASFGLGELAGTCSGSKVRERNARGGC